MFNLYNEILTEHNLHPNNKCSLADATHHQHGINPNCGDEITLSLKLNNNIIEDASFQGSGCAISQASTELCRLFIGMVQGTITDEKELAPLDEALTFKNISKMPARVKCAVLSWHTMETILDKALQSSQ